MAEEKKLKKLEADELENVSGGLTISYTPSDSALTRSQNDLVSKENLASVSGMGMEKMNIAGQAGMKGNMIRAYCPVCKKETLFVVSSGARSQCLVCRNFRTDM